MSSPGARKPAAHVNQTEPVKRAPAEAHAGRRKRTAKRRRSPGRPGNSDLSVGADAIVLKACELLREVAPRDLSLLRLARHAGVDRSLIRYYFTDRSNLLLATARHLFGLLRSRLTVVETRWAEEPEALVREIAVVLLRFQLEHPYFHRLMIEEVVNSPRKDAHEFFESFTVQGIRRFRDIAETAARRGTARAFDGVFLYLAIIGMCEFFVTGRSILQVAFGGGCDPIEVSRQYEAFLRDYVINGIRKR